MSPMELLQADLHARAVTEPYFSGVEKILFRPREKLTATMLQAQIDKALSGMKTTDGKKGAAITVMMPVGDVPEPDMAGPDFSWLVTVRFQEIPMINMGVDGTLKSAEDLALHGAALFHQFSTGYAYIYCAKDALTPVGDPDVASTKITYDLKLACKFGIQYLAKVAAPKIEGTAGAVTITTRTGFGLVSGAAIYYTTDGSYPREGNGTLYGFVLVDESGISITDENNQPIEAPISFAVAEGTVVRAAAYATGYQGSDVDRREF